MSPAVETVATLALVEEKVTVAETPVPAEFSGVDEICATSPEFSDIITGLTTTWVTVFVFFEEPPQPARIADRNRASPALITKRRMRPPRLKTFLDGRISD
jgi:hypothetical protein